jgi:hypothetical protein
MSAIRTVARPALAALLTALPAWGASFTATDNMAMKRLSDPQVSPDGSRIVFSLT